MTKEEFSRQLGNGIINTILSTSQDGYAYTDENGVVLYCNTAYHRITGVPPEEIVGKNVYERVKVGWPVSDLTILVHERREPMSKVIRYSSEGNEILVTTTPIYDDETKKFLGSVSNFRDLTNLNDVRASLNLVELRYQELLAKKETQLAEMRAQLSSVERDMSGVGFVGRSRQMRNLVELATRISSVNSTVLITGESGVGKDVYCRLIHQLSDASKPYVKISCAAIPETLLESELFGYEPGSFTGASKRGKAGILEQAADGIVFLDEIGTMPMRLQSKLLTLLQDRWYYRVGGTKQIPLKARIISATNSDLKQAVAEGTFRGDLYYRLNVIPVHIPPLRERLEDIPFLVDSMVGKLNATYSQNKKVRNSVLTSFKRYHWPGNVRELNNIVERMYVLTTGDIIGEELLPDELLGLPGDALSAGQSGNSSLKETLQRVEKTLLQEALQTDMTLQAIADSLGVSTSTLDRKIRYYQLPQRYRKSHQKTI